MKSTLVAGAVFAASITGAFADLCWKGSQDDGGNYYCQEVTGLSYTGIDGSGSYQKVTNMDDASGTCTQETQNYSGPMAPLDGEV